MLRKIFIDLKQLYVYTHIYVCKTQCATATIQLIHLVAQLVKSLHAMQEAWVQSLGWKDPQEKGKATHSSILAWRIPWTV